MMFMCVDLVYLMERLKNKNLNDEIRVQEYKNCSKTYKKIDNQTM